MVDRPNKPSAITASHASSAPQPHVEYSPDNDTVHARLPTKESVTINLNGATVTSWKSSNGHENLFLSTGAILDGSKPIRGGIPVVFPVFGPPPKSGHATSKLPQHGFARSAKWEYLGKSSSESGAVSKGGDDSVKLDFGLAPSNLKAEQRDAWPYQFALIYSVTLGRDGLDTTLSVRNEGKEAFEFQMLLHTYLAVKDVTKARITGLAGVTYIDKVLDGTPTTTESSSSISITGETDRVYYRIPQNTTSILQENSPGEPRYDVVRDNLSDTVVWNPWKEKAAAMGDFKPDEGYMNMLCVEAGSVDGWTKVEAGEVFEAGQTIKAVF